MGLGARISLAAGVIAAAATVAALAWQIDCDTTRRLCRASNASTPEPIVDTNGLLTATSPEACLRPAFASATVENGTRFHVVCPYFETPGDVSRSIMAVGYGNDAGFEVIDQRHCRNPDQVQTYARPDLGFAILACNFPEWAQPEPGVSHVMIAIYSEGRRNALVAIGSNGGDIRTRIEGYDPETRQLRLGLATNGTVIADDARAFSVEIPPRSGDLTPGTVVIAFNEAGAIDAMDYQPR